jgi:uncharacterized protein YaaN involved in tellurite resistance
VCSSDLIETAKESERGIVDIETLQKTQADLISTIEETLQIQEDGKTQRALAEKELHNMENELKAKLLELSTKGSSAANSTTSQTNVGHDIIDQIENS